VQGWDRVQNSEEPAALALLVAGTRANGSHGNTSIERPVTVTAFLIHARCKLSDSMIAPLGLH
jgi:hypothetical protein